MEVWTRNTCSFHIVPFKFIFVSADAEAGHSRPFPRLHTRSSFLLLSVLDHEITRFISFFRNRILLTACSLSLSRSLRMKARKQVLLEQSESHRQRLEQSWRTCQFFFIKIQRNWSMILTQPKLCSKLSEDKSLPMPKRFFSRLHT